MQAKSVLSLISEKSLPAKVIFDAFKQVDSIPWATSEDRQLLVDALEESFETRKPEQNYEAQFSWRTRSGAR